LNFDPNLSDLTPEQMEKIEKASEYIVQEALREIEDNFEKAARKEAYDTLMRILDESETKINGQHFHQDKLDKYNQIAILCASLFHSEGKINIEEPSQDKPFVGVQVLLEDFEISKSNVEKFVALINLSDTRIFNGDKEDHFRMTFYVNDIWTE